MTKSCEPHSLLNVSLIDNEKIPLNKKLKIFLSQFEVFVFFILIDKKNNGKYISIFPKRCLNVDELKKEGLEINSKIKELKYFDEDFLILPKQFLIDCGIDKKVSVLYCGDSIQIWNPTLHLEYKKILREKFPKELDII